MRKVKFLTNIFLLSLTLHLILQSCSPRNGSFHEKSSLGLSNLGDFQRMKKPRLPEGITISFPWIANVGQIGNNEIKYYAYTDFGAVAVTKDSIYYYFFFRFQRGFPEKIYVLKETFPGARSFELKMNSAFSNTEDASFNMRCFNLNYYTPCGFFENVPVFKSLNLGELWEGVRLVLDVEGAKLVKKIEISTPDAFKRIKIKYQGVRRLTDGGNNTVLLETLTGDFLVKEKICLYLDGKVSHKGSSFYHLHRKSIRLKLSEKMIKQKVEVRLIFQKPHYVDTGKLDEKCPLAAVDNDKVYVAWDINSIPFITEEGVYSLSELTKRGNLGVKDIAVAFTDGALSKVKSCLIISGSDDEFVEKLRVSNNKGLYLSGTTFSKDFPLKPSLDLEKYEQGRYEGKGFLLLLRKDLSGINSVLFAKHVSDFTFAENGEVILSDDESLWRVSLDLSRVEKVLNLSKHGLKSVVEVVKILPKQGILVGGYSFPQNLKSVPGVVVHKDRARCKSGDGCFEEYVPYDSSDAFVALVSFDYSSVKRVLVIGGSDSDVITGAVALGDQGEILVGGTTFSLDFPCVDLVSFNNKKLAGANIFLLILNSDLDGIKKGILLGGNDNDELADIEVDDSGFIYITGTTLSSDFPVPPHGFRDFPYIKENIEWDPHAPVYPTEAYVLKLNGDLRIIGGTFLGGPDNDYACDIQLFANRYLLVSGYSESRLSVFWEQGTKNWGPGSFNVFLSKLSCDLDKVYIPECKK